jgi:hypothetical protein
MAEAAVPPTPTHKKHSQKFWSGNILLISVLLHVLFAVAAGIWVVSSYVIKRQTKFTGPPPTPNPSPRVLQHRVNSAKKQGGGGSPAQSRRIVSTAVSAKVALPDLPTMPRSSDTSPARMGGLGGMGMGQGMGNGFGAGIGGGGGSGGGGGISFFGLRAGGAGLVGTFYDFKRDKGGQPSKLKRGDRAAYTRILKGFASGSEWSPPSSFDVYTSKSQLSAKAFFFPAIVDTAAGDAFNAKGTGPGLWVAHYTGTIVPREDGKYRFVGWGDNVLVVGFNGRIVFNACDVGYVDTADRTSGGAGVAFPRKSSTPLLIGKWFNVRAGDPVKVDILLGDEGGIFCAGLMIQKEGEALTRGAGQLPRLPLFLVAPLSDAEKTLYRKHLDAASLNGPVFPAKTRIISPLDSLGSGT